MRAERSTRGRLFVAGQDPNHRFDGQDTPLHVVASSPTGSGESESVQTVLEEYGGTHNPAVKNSQM